VTAVSLDPAPKRTAVSGARGVLIVGDLPLSRGLMRMVLSRLDYVVACVATAREASAAIAGTRFALALVALRLPDMPGVAFARRLGSEALAPRVPVLLFGDAWDRETVLRECREAGIDGYLQKPISIGRLVAAVRELTQRAFSAGERGPAMTQPEAPLDLQHLRSFTEGDEQLEHELATLYVSTASVYLEEMRRAVRAGGSWQRAAHALKGASANIGARDIAALAARSEREPPTDDLLEAIDASLGRIRAFFEPAVDGRTIGAGAALAARPPVEVEPADALVRRNS
jgi:DNA-binding response OmpR family regulator